MCLIATCRPVHHPQHVDAAGRDEPPHQKNREEKKSNIEPRRVIPRDGRFDDARLVLAGNKAKDAKQSFDNKGSARHRDIECDEQERGHPQPVILAVDVQNRQDEQVGQDECKHAAEADAAVPQHGSEGNVSDRADKGNDSDERPDDRSPQSSQDRTIGQEESISRFKHAHFVEARACG
jgi:hypothetical protein